MPAETTTVGFKTRIHLNNKQISAFETWSRARRRAFNFALNLCEVYLDRIKVTGEKNKLITEINQFDKHFNASKYPLNVKKYGLIGTGLNAWFSQQNVPGSIGALAIKYDLKSAWQKCFKGQAKRPRFQGRWRKDSFTVSVGNLPKKSINGTRLTLPNKNGIATMGDTIPYSEYKLGNTAFSREGDKWYVSFTLTIPADQYYKQPANRERIVGVDLGVKIYAAESSGKNHIAPDKLTQLEQRKARINRKIGLTIHKNLMLMVSGCERCSELVKGMSDKKRLCRPCQQIFHPLMRSRKITKLRASVARIAAKQADIRNNMAHQLTTDLVNRYEFIAIEDLKVANMTKSSKGDADNPGKKVKQKSGLNRVILNVAPFRVREMLNYKADKFGGSIIAVNPAYTSQICSKCGHKSADNRKSQAVFQCVECGHTVNADTNAAINIKERGIDKLKGSN